MDRCWSVLWSGCLIKCVERGGRIGKDSVMDKKGIKSYLTSR